MHILELCKLERIDEAQNTVQRSQSSIAFLFFNQLMDSVRQSQYT
jgi:hypothetical protein